jgi:hypothetical protein
MRGWKDAEAAAGPLGVCESRPVLRSFEASPYYQVQQFLCRPRACLFSRRPIICLRRRADVIKTRVSLSLFLSLSWVFGINPSQGVASTEQSVPAALVLQRFVVGF